ncbi:MAG: 6-carboxytetrahydropterin synthase [Bernardetiaceae bacterium]|nr:6-carboxytetrahydropterin synthase [Bernardetiaceae bacterium]
MVYICRKEHFSAAHKLYNPNWSEQKNKDIFGPCANANWHGHNFTLIVKVKGKIHPDKGWVMDLKYLSKIIKTHVIEAVDHKNLNLDVPFLLDKMPSCEHLVIEFWKILAPLIAADPDSEAQLHSLVLYETENNFVEYYGEE